MHIADCSGDSGIYSRGIVGICIASLGGVDYTTACRYITDGGRDNGIDGVFYEKTKNTLYIVQSKWSEKGTGTIETGDLHKFIMGVYALLNEEWSKFNDRFNTIKNEISGAIKNDPAIVLVIAYNSDNKISSDCKSIIEKFLDDNNLDSQEVVSYKTFSLKDIVRAMRSVHNGLKTDAEVALLQWGEQKIPYYAIYGKVSCADVATWYQAHGDLLFTENIRGCLSDSDINAQIEATILRSPLDFWYLNNGITAIADKIIRRPVNLGLQKDSGNWNIDNLKIVNGAQTTSSIAAAYDKKPDAVKTAYVHIKIISIEDAHIDISNRITTATNTQNKVEPRDFLALDAQQDGFADAFRSIGIQYCFRRGEKVLDPVKGLDVQELAMALAISGNDVTTVVVAKRNAGSLTDPAGYYPKLFSEAPAATLAWKAVQRWRAAAKAVETFSASMTGRDAQLAIHGNRFLEHLLLRSQTSTLNSKDVEVAHGHLKQAIDEHFGESYLAVLFKNAKKCKILRDTIDAQTTPVPV
ncbi:hypothetical protein CCR94_03010 [Rhodoblastus sphagnicola]|uniref:Abortive phage infection protein C-terminal domain-containing protein n=1 Tax=Rhodoblastus sphagnicola TaxID=333368 RepID=A0A2S6NEM1_9HYPH|nr:AIPR family protein [Rhodoblastus sphagnicola]MBB4199980.1 hypothetical protein [Rhodoblastus sphagnicola]PPQ33066.1 hypothetical protein CCR94_03010 [Rhodoblastus sphagnicola]